MTDKHPDLSAFMQHGWTAERVAKLFHDTYERLAPEHGYATRKASSVTWEDVPERNKSLMIATAEEILKQVVQDAWADGYTTGFADQERVEQRLLRDAVTSVSPELQAEADAVPNDQPLPLDLQQRIRKYLKERR